MRGHVQGVGFREATRRRANRLGVLGWVRNADDGSVLVHAEGPEQAVAGLRRDALLGGPEGAVDGPGDQAPRGTRPGEKAQWLLIKRKDDDARPGSDVVAERPESVASGRTLAQVRGGD